MVGARGFEPQAPAPEADSLGFTPLQQAVRTKLRYVPARPFPVTAELKTDLLLNKNYQVKGQWHKERTRNHKKDI